MIDSDRWDEGAEHIDARPQAERGYWPAIYGEARLQIRDRKLDKAKALPRFGARRARALAQGEDLYHRGMAMYYLAGNDLQDGGNRGLERVPPEPADPRHGTLVAQRLREARTCPRWPSRPARKCCARPASTPTASFVHFTGTLYQKAERYNDARDATSGRSQSTRPTRPRAQGPRGPLRSMAKQYDRASKVYLRTSELEPDDVDAMLGLAESLARPAARARRCSAANKAMAAGQHALRRPPRVRARGDQQPRTSHAGARGARYTRRRPTA